jgi:hypothetical protein
MIPIATISKYSTVVRRSFLVVNPLPNQLLLSKTLIGLTALASCGFAMAVQQPASAAALTPVKVELSLLVDVSSSIDSNEYVLQMEGYRDAFINLSPLFGSGEFGDVAVNLIQWSGSNGQEESIPWMLINNQASALQFAEEITLLSRPISSGTAVGSAIQFATPLFSSNDYEGQVWVIDVSGDGRATYGIRTDLARDNALEAGVSAINGLPILPSTYEPSRFGLDVWYENNVQGGVGSFVIPAQGFEDVGRALEEKLRRELTLAPTDPPSADVPEPYSILGICLVGYGLTRFKRHRPA